MEWKTPHPNKLVTPLASYASWAQQDPLLGTMSLCCPLVAGSCHTVLPHWAPDGGLRGTLTQGNQSHLRPVVLT